MAEKNEITIHEDLDGFLGNDPQAIAQLDIATSQDNYERLITAELKQTYPELGIEFAWDGNENPRYPDPDEQEIWENVQRVEERVYDDGKFWVTKKATAAATLGSIRSVKKATASRTNGAKGGRPAREYDDLQELTGYESGAVVYGDGIWVGSWVGVRGLPREFATGTIGLGETLTARRCAVPASAKTAMQEHERENGDTVSQAGWKAWLVNGETIVVVQQSWN